MAAPISFCARNTPATPSSAALQRPTCAWVVGPEGRPERRWTCFAPARR